MALGRFVRDVETFELHFEQYPPDDVDLCTLLPSKFELQSPSVEKQQFQNFCKYSDFLEYLQKL